MHNDYNKYCTIKDDIYEKIMRTKRCNKKISSISLPYESYIILITCDPSMRSDNDMYNSTIFGYKTKISKKITRVNCKWTEQEKFKRMIKENPMAGPLKYFIPIDFVHHI